MSTRKEQLNVEQTTALMIELGWKNISINQSEHTFSITATKGVQQFNITGDKMLSCKKAPENLSVLLIKVTDGTFYISSNSVSYYAKDGVNIISSFK